MGTITKVTRLKIAVPVAPTTSWTEFNAVMKELHEQVRVASNKVMTLCNVNYSNKVWGADLDMKDIRNTAYATARDLAPSLYSYNINSVSKEITDKYFGKGGYMWKIEHGDGNPPMGFKKDIPIPISDKKTLKFVKDDYGRYNFTFALFSTERKKQWNIENADKPECTEMKDCTFTVGIDTTSGSIRSIVDRCMGGEYSICASKIVKNKGRYYINLTYAMQPCVASDLDPNKVLGVDRGYNTAATCAVNYNEYSRKYIGGKSILDVKIEYERLLREQKKKATVIASSGHGRQVKLEISDSIRHKKANYTEKVNREIAKNVVDFAVNMKCGTIHMEDLSGFRQVYASNRYLGEWTYYQLESFIEQKAKQTGIKIQYVDPKYTSQTCSKCGYQDKANRPKDERGAKYFKCLKCGFEADADFNASRNIAMREPLKTK